MKIAYLSGAYKNAGDFLIEKRAVEILNYVLPKVVINRILRSEISDNFDLINSSDVAVIGGGPIYKIDLSGYLPLKSYVEKVKVPTMILGGGWYGSNGSSETIYNYCFNGITKDFFDKVNDDGFGFGCRDWHTVKVLHRNGFQNAVMTGCPAWYDLRNIHNHKLRNTNWDIRNIVISDPAKPVNLSNAYKVVEYVKKSFAHAKITFVFHRGIQQDQYTARRNSNALSSFAEKIMQMGIIVKDIAYSAEGFEIYDNCDLHIGYRVHAHIYNLSIRNKSILIEEDGRGAGVNQALGIPSIKAYKEGLQPSNHYIQKIYSRVPASRNENIVDELDALIDAIVATDGQYYTNAFLLQEKYFEKMISFVKRLSEK